MNFLSLGNNDDTKHKDIGADPWTGVNTNDGTSLPRWMMEEISVGLASSKQGTVFANTATTPTIPFACCKPQVWPQRTVTRYYNKIYRYRERICAANSPGHVIVPGQTNPGTCDHDLSRPGTGNEVAVINVLAERP